METSESLRTGRLSVVLPAYNEEESVPLAADVIGNLLTRAGIDHELIFVNDGSRDHTWRAIQEAAARRPQVRGIRFSRNFGKEAAIFAGLAQARGDCCVVLDCDLQHPPEKILEMYSLWQQGWQVVEGIKVSRGKESPLHTLAAKTFYRFLSGATRLDMSHASDFKLLDRRAVDVLVAMREKNAFFRALSSWIGFDTTQVEFEVQPRAAGQSKWSLRSLTRYAVTNLAAFSTAPLQIVTILGGAGIPVLSGAGLLVPVAEDQRAGLEGFTTVILLLLLIGSALMVCLGILGYYIAKIYEEIKDRPRYIVADGCGGKDGYER